MGDKTGIQWTDASCTPIRARRIETGKIGWHCEHVSTGCEFCYAEDLNNRFGNMLPFKPGHRKDVELFLDETILTAPLRWKRPRMVFMCSMTDMFADFVKDDWLNQICAMMALAKQHTFQVLTKRPERMQAFMANPLRRNEVELAAEKLRPGIGAMAPKHTLAWPLPNLWLGTSTERQEEADERIPHLLRTPAAVRFVSAEPLLGPIDLRDFMWPVHGAWPAKYRSLEEAQRAGEIITYSRQALVHADRVFLDWVIVGGESGRHARACDLGWIYDIVTQCRIAKTRVFVKQLGSAPETCAYGTSDFQPYPTRDKKGGNITEFPPDLQVREWPTTLSSLALPM